MRRQRCRKQSGLLGEQNLGLNQSCVSQFENFLVSLQWIFLFSLKPQTRCLQPFLFLKHA